MLMAFNSFMSVSSGSDQACSEKKNRFLKSIILIQKDSFFLFLNTKVYFYSNTHFC